MNFLSERFMAPFYLEGLFGLNVHKLFDVSEFSKWSNQPKFIQSVTEYFERWTHIWNVNVSVGIFQRNRFHSDDENLEDFAGRHFNFGKFETICRRAGSTNQSRKLHFYEIFYTLKSVIIFSILFFTQFLHCWQKKLLNNQLAIISFSHKSLIFFVVEIP